MTTDNPLAAAARAAIEADTAAPGHFAHTGREPTPEEKRIYRESLKEARDQMAMKGKIE